MSVPDFRHVPKKLHETGLYDLKTTDGHDAFADACVATLNGFDSRWRHLKKTPGQTHVHQHGEDSALYLLPNNEARAVDFIAGAGGPNPQPGWIVDTFPYTHADAHDPDDHGISGGAPPPPAQPSFQYPDEGSVVRRFQDRVRAAYRAVDRSFPDPFDEDAFHHFARYGYSCHEMPEPEAADRHIAELRRALGAPPEPNDSRLV